MITQGALVVGVVVVDVKEVTAMMIAVMIPMT
jgi:hypothetical protein